MAGIKLTNAEIKDRVEKCIELRYNLERPMRQEQWVEYCHETYKDKSEQQYCAYWASAKEVYDERWKAKLDGMLDPAMQELVSLLADDNPKIRQRAVDQILKYSGNDIIKQEIDARLTGEIKISFGSPE